jgi:spore coat polysaccharide biosynthesis protein SpsF
MMDISTPPKQPAIAIIQARCSSSRLPGKVLKPLAGNPMIWHIVERARTCRLVDQVVVATSTEATDDALAAFCEAAEIPCYRGSLNNVLSRYLEVLKLHPHDYVVRITGDCPLIHPPFIDRQIEVLAEHDADMVWVSQPASLLEGQGVHSSRSLRAVLAQSAHADDQEHVGSRFFSEHPGLFHRVGLEIPAQLTGNRWRITVDEEADYELMAALYEALYQSAPIPLEQAIAHLEAHPELTALNRQVPHSAINQELAARRAQTAALLLTTAPW